MRFLKNRLTAESVRLVVVVILGIYIISQGRVAAYICQSLTPRDDTLKAQAEAPHSNERISEITESCDPSQRAVRVAKNRRFNAGGKDLTLCSSESNPQEEREAFTEHYWLRNMSLFPVSQSTAIFLGTLRNVQPFLSEDRSNIYTEISFQIDEIFGEASVPIAIGDTILVDRPGGVLRLKSGCIVQIQRINAGPGREIVGQQYVVFVRQLTGAGDFDMVQGFELRDTEVFGLYSDGGVSFESKRGVPKDLIRKEVFLDAVRRSVAKTP